MEQHDIDGVTYQIVDVVDANYARLENPDDEHNGGDVEYLELDMEVVDAVSDVTEYFSNADESQGEERHGEPSATIVKQVNGTKQSLPIQQNNNPINGKDRNSRKRTISDVSLCSDSNYINISTANNDMAKRKEQKSECDSLDLFFQSMAQTVLHLPPRVQAKIKMDICKVITMAEIKYCSSGNKNTDD
uniref:BESS domain-containing protein n=1 Tax=Bracon brevicornis TaxID=1563983 RepID=A0A6V7KDN9_9HYME